MNNIFLVTLLLGVLNGCHQSNSNEKSNSAYEFIAYKDFFNMQEIEVTPIEINIPQKPASLNLKNHLQEVFFIKLEKTKKSLIARVDKIIMENEQIYILDKKNYKVFVFNNKGNHLLTINRPGKGPGEYIGINDFTLGGDSIIIFDDLGKKLLFFNEKGDFCYEKPIGLRFRNIHRFKSGNYIMAAGSAQNEFLPKLEHFSVFIGEPFEEIKKAGFPNNKFLRKFEYTIGFQFVISQEDLLHSPLLSNTIFCINDDGTFYRKYSLNIYKSLPEDYHKRCKPDDFHKYVQSNRITYFLGSFVENDTHLFLRLNPPDRNYSYLWFNKENKNIKYYDKVLINDYYIPI